MKLIKIFKDFSENTKVPVDDFDISTIKSILGNRIDFLFIILQEDDEVIKRYSNGIILTFDEVLDIVGENQRYSEIKREIERHRFFDTDSTFISGYEDYKERVLYTPYNKSFRILYSKPDLITDIIPGFVANKESLMDIKSNSKEYKEFYSRHSALLNLFDKFVSIIEHPSHIELFNLNFEKLGFNYISILDFFACYEAFFEIKNLELYKFLKESILNKMAKSFDADNNGILLS